MSEQGKQFETQYGYFAEDGNEFIIKTPQVPKPWINILTNGDYSLTLSQTCGGFSWLTHSELNRLTRWQQDLVRDNWGKYLYIKDEETGEVWNPGWLPTRTDLDHYECRHGFGYTTFVSEYKGIRLELTIFVPFDDTLEIWDIRIHNKTDRQRRLSVYSYLEWCLGTSGDNHREFHKSFIKTEFDPQLNALIARKRLWNVPLGDRGPMNLDYPNMAFHACNAVVSGCEGDKETFLGRYGDPSHPIAIERGDLTGETGAGQDAIASLKVQVDLNAQSGERFAFYLGITGDKEELATTLDRYRNAASIDNALTAVRARWQALLGTLEVETPDAGLNLLVSKWLRYQAIAGRLWARAAYYQQSGAFGFRDQLQDSQVFLPIDPALTGNQIRLHAEHQLEDGSALQWWHPLTEEGAQYTKSDTPLWLPFVMISYLDETGDYSLLDEKVSYHRSSREESLFQHCYRAIDFVLGQLSERGLPYIGAGDWNDGLSGVGPEMKGESVWLAQFLYLVLTDFQRVADRYGDSEVVSRYREAGRKLQAAIEQHTWDGSWFQRATDDDGRVLGSQECEAGRIYLNPQVWSVISNCTTRDRQQRAMASVREHLLKDYGPLLLFPAYKEPDEYIGYLSRYGAGIRENGGVYCHAATWAIWAFCRLGQAEEAYDIFTRISPIRNGADPERYQAEPYVMPGNIEGPESSRYGRGGWTWYTGSAAWLQKVVVEWILGVRATEEGLLIDPCIPPDWDGYTVRRLFRGCTYRITVHNPGRRSQGVQKILVDGTQVESNLVTPVGAGECTIEVWL